MVIITKEKNSDEESLSNSPTGNDINPEARKILENINQRAMERREAFEKSTPPCPQDGKPSVFVRYEGSYMIAKGVFRCENGHEFYVG